MKGLLLQLGGILLSSFYYSNLITASPSPSPVDPGPGPGPAFEPATGSSEDTMEFQQAYRDLFDESAALRDEMCPMCILAVRRAGDSLNVKDLQQIKESLGSTRFLMLKKVRKELRVIKANSYQQVDQIPSYKAPSECTKVLSNLILENAAQDLDDIIDEADPFFSVNGGIHRERLLRARGQAIRDFIKDIENDTIEFSCTAGSSPLGVSA